jgi:hypothetical protein
LVMPCRRTHAANLRSGGRMNEGGLASNVIQAFVGGAAGLPTRVVVVACMLAEPLGPATAAANRPRPMRTISPPSCSPRTEGRTGRDPAVLVAVHRVGAMRTPYLLSLTDPHRESWRLGGCKGVTEAVTAVQPQIRHDSRALIETIPETGCEA